MGGIARRRRCHQQGDDYRRGTQEAAQLILETGNEVAGAVQVDEGFAIVGRVEDLVGVVGQFVLDGYDTVPGDLYDGFLSQQR